MYMTTLYQIFNKNTQQIKKNVIFAIGKSYKIIVNLESKL